MGFEPRGRGGFGGGRGGPRGGSRGMFINLSDYTGSLHEGTQLAVIPAQ
jgi:hypothetical protein